MNLSPDLCSLYSSTLGKIAGCILTLLAAVQMGVLMGTSGTRGTTHAAHEPLHAWHAVSVCYTDLCASRQAFMQIGRRL